MDALDRLQVCIPGWVCLHDLVQFVYLVDQLTRILTLVEDVTSHMSIGCSHQATGCRWWAFRYSGFDARIVGFGVSAGDHCYTTLHTFLNELMHVVVGQEFELYSRVLKTHPTRAQDTFSSDRD